MGDTPRLDDLHVTRALAPGAAGPAPASETVATTFVETPVLPGAALDARLGPADVPARTAEDAARYELRGLVGMGATSRVYTAFDRDLAREVAVKVLQPGGEAPADEVSSFIDEARITARLSHPNVLPVYQLDAAGDGRVFFTMKRIEGRSLGQALEAQEAGEVPAADTPGALAGPGGVVSVFVGVCQALAYAHHRGVVHQDVKPDNIMLGSFGEVLLVDWGSAALLGDAKPKLYGTPLYMSPEQARLEGVDARSDVYCVGASLFHALVGRPPLLADSLEALMERKRAGAHDAPTRAEARRAPPALLAIALKAMAAEPARRYQTMEAMLADLRAYQDGLAVSAHRDTPWASLARWYRRNRRLAWVSAVAALAVLLAGGAWWSEKAKERAGWLVVADGIPADPAALERDWVGLRRQEFRWELPFSEAPLTAAPFTHQPGSLTMTARREQTNIAWRGVLLGDFRVEWDYRCTHSAANLNCYVGRTRDSGLLFHIAGWGSPYYAVLTFKDRTLEQRTLPEPIQLGRVYRYMLEKDGGMLRLAIDGAVVIEYPAYDPLGEVDATSFGFDVYPTNTVEISNVSVRQRPLPQRIAPVAVARKAYQLGRADEALRLYDELITAYPGTDVAASAAFERAVCLVRSGEAERGDAALADFESAHPSHAMAPMAAYERLSAARRRTPRDDAQVTALRSRLVAYRGHPVLSTALAELSEDLFPMLREQPPKEVGDRRYPSDIVERILRARAELDAWAQRYGLSVMNTHFVRQGRDVLINAGSPEEALARWCADPRERARTLTQMGRFEEALPLVADDRWLTAGLLIDLGRSQEMLDRGLGNDDQKAAALRLLGREDEALERYPSSPTASTILLEREEFAEHERRWPLDRIENAHRGFNTQQWNRLVRLQQFDALVERWNVPTAVAEGQFGRGEWELSATTSPVDRERSLSAAINLIRVGRREAGFDLLQRALRYDPLWGSPEIGLIFGVIGPLVPLLAAGGGDPAPALAEVLEHQRWSGAQRPWHLAALITGRIDEAAFRRQPAQRGVEEGVILARALAADCAGREAEAIAGWRALRALPHRERTIHSSVTHLSIWRLEALGQSTQEPAAGAPR